MATVPQGACTDQNINEIFTLLTEILKFNIIQTIIDNLLRCRPFAKAIWKTMLRSFGAGKCWELLRNEPRMAGGRDFSLVLLIYSGITKVILLAIYLGI